MVKSAIKAFLCLLFSTAVVVAFSWWYIIHFARTTGLTEQNVNPFMWSVIAASVLLIAGLTVLGYRIVG
jgi:heme/copper-type cytochrome/quinol oxidase subunit 1